MANTNHDGGKPKTSKTIADAGDTVAERAREAVKGLESNPIGVLVGGLAVGLVAGALVPRGEREKKLLKPVGATLAAGAVAALGAAKDTGKNELSSALKGKDAAKASLKTVLDSVVSAAKDAAATAKSRSA